MLILGVRFITEITVWMNGTITLCLIPVWQFKISIDVFLFTVRLHFHSTLIFLYAARDSQAKDILLKSFLFPRHMKT